MYETDKLSNMSAPATVMTNHQVSRPLPAQILLAISSVSQDFEAEHTMPTSDTIALMLEGISLLKGQIQQPNGVSDDTIQAVINLWIYEVTLNMDAVKRSSGAMSSQGQMVSRALASNIQTHINGLQRSVGCLGGLQSLSSETSWLLAW